MVRITSTIAAFGLLAGAAQAEVVLTFGFTDTSGSYDTGTSTFSAVSVDTPEFSTGGDVTRLAAPGGTAEFDTGFASGGSSAAFAMSLDVTAKMAGTAKGAGSFTITDADGDTVTGTISGDWISGGGDIVFFNGLITDVILTDVGTLDGTFDGPSSGSFGLDIAGQPLEGALVSLFIATGSGFFDTGFSGVSTQVDGVVIPAPAGVLALTGIGLMAVRRRRD